MKLNQFLKNELVKRARQGLKFLETELETQNRKTDQQRNLDTIFAKHPNDPNWNDFADIVKSITGYRPTTSPGLRENFQIVTRPNVSGSYTWMILKARMYGFCNLAQGQLVLYPTDRLATPKEARAFIKDFESISEDGLAKWCVNHLGDDFFTTI